jgi:hypothetical protein
MPGKGVSTIREMVKISLGIFFLLLVFTAAAQNFVARDVLVSAPDAQIGDFEIDPYQKRICWQSLNDHKLWVCHLDTVTWALTEPYGREILVDSLLTPLSHSSNGGEWGYDMNYTYIVYSKQISKTRYISAATEIPGGWYITPFLDAPHRMNPHASRNPEDSVAIIYYIRNPFSVNTKFKFLSHPDDEYAVTCFSDTHWMDEDQLMTGILFNDQAGIFDPNDPADPVQLTFDSSLHYSQPYMWRAPEHGNGRMLFARANNNEIRIFREYTPNSNQFGLYQVFRSPSSNPVYDQIASPEPFVFDGHSYITFMVSASPKENANLPAEIWIAKVDSLAPEYRLISDSATGIRTDPEAFATTDRLLVYYTEVIDPASNEPVYRMRQCETGYRIGVLTGNGEMNGDGARPYRVFPNPFTTSIAVQPATGREEYRLTNPAGQLIWSGRNIDKQDFSGLKGTVYFLQITDGTATHTVQAVKE